MSLELDVEGLRVLNISPFKVKQAKTCFTSTGSCDLRRPRLPRSIRLPEMEENKLLNSKKRIFSLKTIWEKTAQARYRISPHHTTRKKRSQQFAITITARSNRKRHKFRTDDKIRTRKNVWGPGVLHGPVEVLAYLLEDGGADLGERHFSELRFREAPWGGQHVADGLGDHGGLLVDHELEALGADQLHDAFLLHLLRYSVSQEISPPAS